MNKLKGPLEPAPVKSSEKPPSNPSRKISLILFPSTAKGPVNPPETSMAPSLYRTETVQNYSGGYGGYSSPTLVFSSWLDDDDDDCVQNIDDSRERLLVLAARLFGIVGILGCGTIFISSRICIFHAKSRFPSEGDASGCQERELNCPEGLRSHQMMNHSAGEKSKKFLLY